jgi:hypothetical protein
METEKPTPAQTRLFGKIAAPVINNAHGKGLGDGQFWISAECPCTEALSGRRNEPPRRAIWNLSVFKGPEATGLE